jgi:hypothetical protein
VLVYGLEPSSGQQSPPSIELSPAAGGVSRLPRCAPSRRTNGCMYDTLELIGLLTTTVSSSPRACADCILIAQRHPGRGGPKGRFVVGNPRLERSWPVPMGPLAFPSSISYSRPTLPAPAVIATRWRIARPQTGTNAIPGSYVSAMAGAAGSLRTAHSLTLLVADHASQGLYGRIGRGGEAS